MTDSTQTPDVAALAPVFHGAATRSDLEDWGPLEEATGPEMRTAGLTLWQDGDGAEAGIWQCSAGPSRWHLETNELVHVLSGAMTVTPDGGTSVDVGSGDVVFFPRGWSGTWEIHETLRKVYAIF